MKQEELIKLRKDIIELVYKYGGIEDRKDLFTKTRLLINFIATGNSLKKPEVDKD